MTRLDRGNGHSEATRRAKVSAAYSARVRAVAEAVPGVGLVDLWQAVMDRAAVAEPDFRSPGAAADGAAGPWLGDPELGLQGGLDELLPDGLHMSGEAYRVFYEVVAPLIGQEWEGLEDEDRQGFVFPDWKVMNPPK